MKNLTHPFQCCEVQYKYKSIMMKILVLHNVCNSSLMAFSDGYVLFVQQHIPNAYIPQCLNKMKYELFLELGPDSGLQRSETRPSLSIKWAVKIQTHIIHYTLYDIQ